MIPYSIGTQLLNYAFNMFKRTNEEDRQKFYLNMSAFYFRIKSEMEAVIKNEFLKKPFSEKTLQNLFYFHDDVIDKIISRKTAGTLSQNPIILYADKEDETLNNFLYEINFWETIKEVYKRSKYFNTIILYVVYDSESKKIRLDILQGDSCAVIPKKDYLLIAEIKLARVNEEQEIYYTYWSAKEHYILDGSGNKINVENNPQGLNPYKSDTDNLPFSIYRDKIGWDFWGEPNIALYTFQMLHTLKVSDNERGEFYYKFPIGIGKNLPVVNEEEMSPGKIINVDNPNTQAQIGLEYINTNTGWAEIRENETSRKENFLTNQKIPSSSASIEIKALSGYAKTIDELELVESKEDDKSNLIRFIYDAIDKILMVAKYNGALKESYDIKKVTVQLQELKTYESETDKWLRREKELTYGMKDIIDFIMEDEQCNEAEAKKILEAKRTRRVETKITDVTEKQATLNDLFPNE